MFVDISQAIRVRTLQYASEELYVSSHLRTIHEGVSSLRCRVALPSLLRERNDTSYESSQTISQRPFNVFARHSAGIIFRDNDRTTFFKRTSKLSHRGNTENERIDERDERERERERIGYKARGRA